MKKNDIVIDKNVGKLASIIKANDPYLRVKYIDDNEEALELGLQEALKLI